MQTVTNFHQIEKNYACTFKYNRQASKQLSLFIRNKLHF